jgi:hypothetical protein
MIHKCPSERILKEAIGYWFNIGNISSLIGGTEGKDEKILSR